MLQDCLASFQAVQSSERNEKPVSVIQLQFFRRNNWAKEHASLVKKLLAQYGSKRKASLALGVSYKSLLRLCEPAVQRKNSVNRCGLISVHSTAVRLFPMRINVNRLR